MKPKLTLGFVLIISATVVAAATVVSNSDGHQWQRRTTLFIERSSKHEHNGIDTNTTEDATTDRHQTTQPLVVRASPPPPKMGWFGRIVGGLLGSSGSNSGVVNHEETSEHREPEPWIAMKDHEGLFDGLLLAANTEVDGWMMNEFRATAPIARHLSDYSSDNEGDDTDVYSFESVSMHVSITRHHNNNSAQLSSPANSCLDPSLELTRHGIAIGFADTSAMAVNETHQQAVRKMNKLFSWAFCDSPSIALDLISSRFNSTITLDNGWYSLTSIPQDSVSTALVSDVIERLLAMKVFHVYHPRPLHHVDASRVQRLEFEISTQMIAGVHSFVWNVKTFTPISSADLIAKSGSSTQPDSDNSSAKERSDIALHKSATSKRAKLPLHEVNVAFIGSQSADTKAYNCKVSRIWRYLGGDDHIERGWNVLELNATASGEAEPITVAASLSNVPSLHPELHLKLYDIDVKHAVKPADIQAIIHLGTHVFADPYQLSDRAPEIGKSYHYGTIELEAPGETFAAKSPQNWGTVVHTPKVFETVDGKPVTIPLHSRYTYVNDNGGAVQHTLAYPILYTFSNKTSDTGSSDAEWYRVSPMSPVIVRLQQQLLRPANANHDVQFVHTARSPPLQFVIPVGKRTDSKFVSPITVVVMVLGALHIAWAVASR